MRASLRRRCWTNRPTVGRAPLCFDNSTSRRIIGFVLALLGALGSPVQAQNISRFSSASGDKPPAPWRVLGFPGGDKPVTQFDIVTLDGERVLRVQTDKSYGTVQHDLPKLVLTAGSTLGWRWRLDQPLRDADLRRKSGDDVPLKVCASFDLPTSKLGLLERGFLQLARSHSTDFVPAATLCYIWDHKLAVGTELPNAFTRRVRYLVLNSGDSQLKTWITHERDLVADFLRAFGEDADNVPPFVGVAIGADADNTAATSLGFVGDLGLRLQPKP